MACAFGFRAAGHHHTPVGADGEGRGAVVPRPDVVCHPKSISLRVELEGYVVGLAFGSEGDADHEDIPVSIKRQPLERITHSGATVVRALPNWVACAIVLDEQQIPIRSGRLLAADVDVSSLIDNDGATARRFVFSAPIVRNPSFTLLSENVRGRRRGDEDGGHCASNLEDSNAVHSGFLK